MFKRNKKRENKKVYECEVRYIGSDEIEKVIISEDGFASYIIAGYDIISRKEK